METPQGRAEEAGPGHADNRVGCDNRDVRHQGQLESSAQRIATHLRHGRLRIALKVVVKLEGPPIHGQLAALAWPTTPSSLCPVTVRLLCLGAVPRIRVVHIGAGAEDTA